MSNVIALNAHVQRRSQNGRLARHINCFANARRSEEDVFWLKENAELLNILASTGATLRQADLATYERRYTALVENISFYPQYYRFWLSICLDLEDLGMTGQQGEMLCDWVAEQGLPEAELSDLQRAEAERLLMRRGAIRPDADLHARLIRFISRPETFAIPNKKAAYELTHILFYLSDYGRITPELPEAARTALDYAGTLAFLEQNYDLLAEICIARAYAGMAPNAIWDAAVKAALQGFSASGCAPGPIDDAYHCYFVTSWWAALTEGTAFSCDPGENGAWFAAPMPPARPLGEISAELRLFRGGCVRTDWQAMRPFIEARLSEAGWDVMEQAIAAAPDWDGFFEIFARGAAPTVELPRHAL